jgi:polyhydroxybutyrate depolymerase
MTLLKIAAVSLALLAVAALWTCFAQPHGNQEGMSPGPSGVVLGERDYRVPLLWLNVPGKYGPGEYGRRLSFGGRSRYYEMHVPPQYTPKQPAPLVLVLHGGGGNPAVVRYESRMNEVSDQHGFLVVYPAATSPLFTDRLLFWNAGVAPKNRRQRDVDDVAFLAAVLDDVARFFSIDPSRIYATGISNGAHMCYLLAARLQDRIAAIGPVAGQRKVGQYAPIPSGPVALIHFHGRHDRWALFDGGLSNPDKSGFEQYEIAPAMEAVKSWVAHNGCAATPEETRVGHARRLTFAPCQGGAEVVFWILEDGGHTWPGGRVTRIEEREGVGKINTDISASEQMWRFFEKHPKSSP